MKEESPNNLRRINFAISQGILHVLNEKGELDFDTTISLALDIAADIDDKINYKTTSGKETIEELRRLGLIQRKGKNIQKFLITEAGITTLNKIRDEGLEKTLFTELYEKERLFREFIDILKRRKTIEYKELLEISGTNQVRNNFIRSISREMPNIVRTYKKGKTTAFDYIGSQSLSEDELRKLLIRTYFNLINDQLFLKINDVWLEIKKQYPNLEESDFDQSILSLASQNIGQVELSQGVSITGEKNLLDNKSNTYYHYIKIKA